MDNQAFAALVKERAAGKSTREIAREAVEQEHRRYAKTKRQRPGDDISSDEDNNNKPTRKAGKIGRVVGHEATLEKEEDKRRQAELSAKYRDRAQERREQQGLTVVAPRPMPGRSAADLLFEQAVERAENGMDDGNNDYALGLHFGAIDRDQAAAHTPLSDRIATQADARAYLRDVDISQLKSQLGRDALSVLRGMYTDTDTTATDTATATTSPTGKALQNSFWTFSIRAHPGDTARAWEMPRLSQQQSTGDTTTTLPATPIPSHLIAKMQASKLRATTQAAAKVVAAHTIAQAAAAAAAATVDSDDDIFGNAGDDYVPDYDQESDDDNDGKGAVVNKQTGARSFFADPGETKGSSRMLNGASDAMPETNTAGGTVSSRLQGLSRVDNNDGDVTNDGYDYDDDDDNNDNQRNKAKNKKKRGTAGDNVTG